MFQVNVFKHYIKRHPSDLLGKQTDDSMYGEKVFHSWPDPPQHILSSTGFSHVSNNKPCWGKTVLKVWSGMEVFLWRVLSSIYLSNKSLGCLKHHRCAVCLSSLNAKRTVGELLNLNASPKGWGKQNWLWMRLDMPGEYYTVCPCFHTFHTQATTFVHDWLFKENTDAHYLLS